MSHFAFGDVMGEGDEIVRLVRSCAAQAGLLVHVGPEIPQTIVSEMLANFRYAAASTTWLLTTSGLRDTSDEIIGPMEPSDHATANLISFGSFLMTLLKESSRQVRLFVTEGFDTEFTIRDSSVEEALQDLRRMMFVEHYITSTSYRFSADV